jgi:hypothetical protein
MKKMIVAIAVIAILVTSGFALAQGWGGEGLDMVLVLVALVLRVLERVLVMAREGHGVLA